MNRTKRTPIIAISVILISALLVLLGFAGLYLYSEKIIFNHRDSSEVHSAVPPVEGFSVKYPFFANPMALSGSDGRAYTLTLLNGGEKTLRYMRL